jgi:hypothetical protein
MKTAHRILPAALLLLLVSGCASVGGAALFRQELGTATEPDATTVMERVSAHFHYTVDRREEPPNFWIQTHWQGRPPFDDERAQGIIEAETRLLLTGRQRIDSLLGSQFAMTLVVENRTRTGPDVDWVETVNTPMFVEYAKSIAERIEQDFRTIGVRRFERIGI